MGFPVETSTAPAGVGCSGRSWWCRWWSFGVLLRSVGLGHACLFVHRPSRRRSRRHATTNSAPTHRLFPVYDREISANCRKAFITVGGRIRWDTTANDDRWKPLQATASKSRCRMLESCRGHVRGVFCQPSTQSSADLSLARHPRKDDGPIWGCGLGQACRLRWSDGLLRQAQMRRHSSASPAPMNTHCIADTFDII